jgi:hypothetical protein
LSSEDVSVDENHHEIIEPSAKKTSYTQVTSREDEIIEKNFEKSVQVTDGLHQENCLKDFNRCLSEDFIKNNILIQNKLFFSQA